MRASLLKAELASNLSDFGESSVREMRRIESIAGFSRLSFLELPRRLKRASGSLIEDNEAYCAVSRLRKALFSDDFQSIQLVEAVWRFTFESIEPLMIDM